MKKREEEGQYRHTQRSSCHIIKKKDWLFCLFAFSFFVVDRCFALFCFAFISGFVLRSSLFCVWLYSHDKYLHNYPPVFLFLFSFLVSSFFFEQ